MLVLGFVRVRPMFVVQPTVFASIRLVLQHASETCNTRCGRVYVSALRACDSDSQNVEILTGANDSAEPPKGSFSIFNTALMDETVFRHWPMSGRAGGACEDARV